ncbi:hypothetical protein N9L45_00600 [Planctomycetota bacterium]|nr:hypothetical protein [Planctomycetota bacterium]MDB4733834.1 hypothetical protein [Planctomycetota bacterium]
MTYFDEDHDEMKMRRAVERGVRDAQRDAGGKPFNYCGCILLMIPLALIGQCISVFEGDGGSATPVDAPR